jgi:hypothetical protein
MNVSVQLAILIFSLAFLDPHEGWAEGTSQRFLVTRDSTVTDTKTGLIWEKKAAWDGVEDPKDLHDVDNRYAWAGKCLGPARRGNCPTADLPDAHEWREIDMVWCQPTAEAAAACPHRLSGCTVCGKDEGPCVLGPPGTDVSTVWAWLAQLNATKFAGHRDWRLPTTDELRELVEAGTKSKWATADFGPPFIDVAFHTSRCKAGCKDIRDPDCSCTALTADQTVNRYWTMMLVDNDPINTWAVADQGAAAADAMTTAV